MGSCLSGLKGDGFGIVYSKYCTNNLCLSREMCIRDRDHAARGVAPRKGSVD